MNPSTLQSRIPTAMRAGLGSPRASRTVRRIVWTLALLSR